MIEVVVLGSSGSSPAKERQMPCVALRREGEVFLFDCGEGTQMQMLRYGVNAYRIKAIFVSHAHGDHVIGIAGLVRTLALSNRKDPLEIFVPEGQERIVRSLVAFDKAMIGYEVRITGVGSGKIYVGRGFHVRAFRLNHTIPCSGYSFEEEERFRFDAKKAKRLGISGSMFSEIGKRGRLKIKGKVVSLKSVTSTVKGLKIVYAADSRPSKNTEKFAKDADLLIHESSYTEEYRKLALERKHSTAKEAATVALHARAKMLVLVHISTRFKTTEPLLIEASSVFKNTKVAHDGEIIKIGGIV